MFKVVWDPQGNGVQLTISSKGDTLNVSPRPVFWEELDLLELNKMGWIYPHVEEPLLWACDRRYFYKGNFVLEVKGGNVYDSPTVIQQEGYESLILSPVDIERLRSLNEDTMFIIEHEAMQKTPTPSQPKEKKEKPKGGTKESEKLVRRLEREIEKQEQLIAQLDERIEAAAADYQELSRLLIDKEEAETALIELMEQWENAQS